MKILFILPLKYVSGSQKAKIKSFLKENSIKITEM